MANTIQLKRGTGSAVPSQGSLAEGELAINLDSGKLFYGSGSSVLSDFRFDKITAETYVISSSVTHMTTSFSSGSTAFGDTADDTHTFTGDITASGNISASGTITANAFVGNITGDLTGEAATVATIAGLAPNTATTQATQGAITSLGTLTGLNVNSHITASGNISASGTIVGSNLSGTNTGDQSLVHLAVTGSDVIFGNITASGNISSSGQGIFDTINVKSSITGSYPKLTDSAGDTIFKISGVVQGSTSKIEMGDVDNSGNGEVLILDNNSENPIFYNSSAGLIKWGINNNPQNSSAALTVAGDISASGTITAGDLSLTGEITASGDISSSANIYAADYFDSGTNISSIYSPIASPTFTGTVAIPNIANVETAIAANTAKVTNVPTALSVVTANNKLWITSDGTTAIITGATNTYWGAMTDDHVIAQEANTAKATNVSTNLTATTHASQITINSSDGTNVIIAEASDTIAGVMSVAHHDKLDGIEASATADQTQADINGLAITTVGTLDSLTMGGNISTDDNNIDAGSGEVSAQLFIGQIFQGPANNDLEISSDGNITFVLDDDNDETAQKFIFKNDTVEIATLNESGDLQLDGTLIASRKYELPSSTVGDFKGGDIYYYGDGSTVKGGIYYINGTNWTLADADAEASTAGLLAVALGTDPDVDGMLLRGFVTLLTEVEGTEAIGSVLYLSATNSGKATVTAPGSGDFVRVLGYSLHATENQVYFNPDNTWVEVA